MVKFLGKMDTLTTSRGNQRKIKISYKSIPFIIDFKLCLCTRSFDLSVQPLGLL